MFHQTAPSLFPDYPTAPVAAAVGPALKWAGGKRWLLPHLRPLWQPFAGYRLVEPFVGGMAVALGLQPTRALLADSNEHLINFYRWLQRGLVIGMPMRNDEVAFYAARSRFNALARDGGQWSAEAAGLFYYLNRTCFNGLCRFNGKNEFNVPFGRYKTINYTTDFSPYRDVLGSWHFENQDFAQTPLAPTDFLYADPPYDTPFSRYGKDDFTWDDQRRLAHWLAQAPGPVVTTNQATPRILDLYADAGFRISTLLAPRRIASSGDRTPALEILATRNI